MKRVEDATAEEVNVVEQTITDEKNELMTKIVQMRNHEKIQCLIEIESVCAKYQFRLDAEVIINSQGNHTNVFLVDMSK
jgi:hypothetical protein